jgi:hypothetical protein
LSGLWWLLGRDDSEALRARKNYASSLKGDRFREEVERLDSTWTEMFKKREIRLRGFLDRINKKKEEVESLRDGVSQELPNLRYES